MEITYPRDEFFQRFEELIDKNGITIDRPKGTAHPRFPDFIYKINYGFINNTKSQDGGGIDIFEGTENRGVVGFICTIDSLKNDSEVKVLYNCSEDEIKTAVMMLSQGYMSCVLVLR